LKKRWCKQISVQIIGTGHGLPQRVLNNKVLEAMVDTTHEWIVERTGILERRIADPHTATSDLAVEAAEMALKRAEIDAGQLDLIIVATITPDMLTPSTACLVQKRLGAFKAAAFDISAGCTGFIYALTIGQQYLNNSPYGYALIIGADALSKVVDYTDRNTCVLFGDGAGAAVLAKGKKDGIIHSYLGADGTGSEFLYIPAGGSALPSSNDTVNNRLHFLKMNGNEIFRFATRITYEISDKIMLESGFSYSDIDLFIPHQSNLRIIKTALKRMSIPMEKALINLERFGNMSAACIPVALSMAEKEGRIQPGNLVLMVSFGAGLTFGGSLVRWGRD
jgi:3-oxoacyl-[acyl-carrier-protein] synthase-3